MEGRVLSEELVGKYKRAEPTPVAAWGRGERGSFRKAEYGTGKGTH